jgi:hypothetical protein
MRAADCSNDQPDLIPSVVQTMAFLLLSDQKITEIRREMSQVIEGAQLATVNRLFGDRERIELHELEDFIGVKPGKYSV